MVKKITQLFPSSFQSPLAMSGLIVFAGNMAANAGAYLYHLIMGRMLGPVGYGELSSLISLLYIFGVPINVMALVLVKYFSGFKAENRTGFTRYLFEKLTKTLIRLLGLGLVVFAVMSPLIAGFLHLKNWVSLIWVYGMFAGSLLMFVNSSLLQAYQIFTWFALLASLTVILKLIISIPLASLGVSWVVFGGFISGIIAYAFYFIPVRFIFKSVPEKIQTSSVDLIRTSMITLVTMLSITSLFSTDIILVKHFLSPVDSGIYAALSVLGKIVFYAGSSVVAVIYPVIAERRIKKIPTGRLILKSFSVVAAISAVICLIYFVFPAAVMHALFGQSYDSGIGSLGIMGVFITVYSCAYIVVLAALATAKKHIWIPAAVAALTQIIIISVFHSGISQIITVNIAVSLILLAGSFAVLKSHE